MAYNRQEERFGRVTGNTLRRNTFPSYYANQFISKKRNTARTHVAPQPLPGVNVDADLMDVQLEELINDGDLQGSGGLKNDKLKRGILFVIVKIELAVTNCLPTKEPMVGINAKNS